MCQIKIPNSLLYYIILQRTSYLNIYFHLLPVFLKKISVFFFQIRIKNKYNQDMISDYESMEDYFPQNISNILDIGCGIAGLDIHIYKKNNQPNIHLLDRTAMDSSVYYGFEQEGSYYNSLVLAKSFLVINGVREDKIFLYDLEKNTPNFSQDFFDLVISTISWGFHYPVSTYLRIVADSLKSSGVLILDIRKNTGGEQELELYFDVKPIKDYGKHIRYYCKKK